MLGVTVVAKGDFSGLAKQELDRLRPRVARGVADAAILFADALRETLTGARNGRVYYITKGSRKGTLAPHVASAPGEPPAVMFGDLRRSVVPTSPPDAEGRVKWSGRYAASVTVGVGGTGAPYARRLEYGGTDSRGVRILPRPYVAPTLVRERGAMRAAMARALDGLGGARDG